MSSRSRSHSVTARGRSKTRLSKSPAAFEKKTEEKYPTTEEIQAKELMCLDHLEKTKCTDEKCCKHHEKMYISKGKTLCSFWANGRCTRGENCKFSHDPDAIRKLYVLYKSDKLVKLANSKIASKSQRDEDARKSRDAARRLIEEDEKVQKQLSRDASMAHRMAQEMQEGSVINHPVQQRNTRYQVSPYRRNGVITVERPQVCEKHRDGNIGCALGIACKLAHTHTQYDAKANSKLLQVIYNANELMTRVCPSHFCNGVCLMEQNMQVDGQDHYSCKAMHLSDRHYKGIARKTLKEGFGRMWQQQLVSNHKTHLEKFTESRSIAYELKKFNLAKQLVERIITVSTQFSLTDAQSSQGSELCDEYGIPSDRRQLNPRDVVNIHTSLRKDLFSPAEQRSGNLLLSIVDQTPRNPKRTQYKDFLIVVFEVSTEVNDYVSYGIIDPDVRQFISSHRPDRLEVAEEVSLGDQ